jgi:hypothetical protein
VRLLLQYLSLVDWSFRTLLPYELLMQINWKGWEKLLVLELFNLLRRQVCIRICFYSGKKFADYMILPFRP